MVDISKLMSKLTSVNNYNENLPIKDSASLDLDLKMKIEAQKWCLGLAETLEYHIDNKGILVLKDQLAQVFPVLSNEENHFEETVAGPQGHLHPNAVRAKQLITQIFGITNIGGYRPEGSISSSDHPKGLALDVMVGDNFALGERVSAWAIQNARDLKIKYIIWYNRSWNPERGTWAHYNHPSGGTSKTLRHEDHVHISFLGV
jgi:hypothetical protein